MSYSLLLNICVGTFFLLLWKYSSKEQPLLLAFDQINTSLINKSIYFLKIYFLNTPNDIAFWTWLHCLNTFQACISLDTVCHTYFSHEQLVLQKHLPDMIFQSRWNKGRNEGKSDGGLPAGPHKALMQAFPKISSESWVSLTKAGSTLSLLDWLCTWATHLFVSTLADWYTVTAPVSPDSRVNPQSHDSTAPVTRYLLCPTFSLLHLSYFLWLLVFSSSSRPQVGLC